jgi:threonyl-tRNA synthetase
LSPLLALNIRAFTGASSDKIGAKIRLAHLEKVSYMLVLGAREKRGGEVAMQRRKSGNEGSVSASRFVDPNGSERT